MINKEHIENGNRISRIYIYWIANCQSIVRDSGRLSGDCSRTKVGKFCWHWENKVSVAVFIKVKDKFNRYVYCYILTHVIVKCHSCFQTQFVMKIIKIFFKNAYFSSVLISPIIEYCWGNTNTHSGDKTTNNRKLNCWKTYRKERKSRLTFEKTANCWEKGSSKL